MKYLASPCRHIAVLAAVVAALAAQPARANDITTEWATVKPAPT